MRIPLFVENHGDVVRTSRFRLKARWATQSESSPSTIARLRCDAYLATAETYNVIPFGVSEAMDFAEQPLGPSSSTWRGAPCRLSKITVFLEVEMENGTVAIKSFPTNFLLPVEHVPDEPPIPLLGCEFLGRYAMTLTMDFNAFDLNAALQIIESDSAPRPPR